MIRLLYCLIHGAYNILDNYEEKVWYDFWKTCVVPAFAEHPPTDSLNREGATIRRETPIPVG